MSIRSSILSTPNGTHIYHETSQWLEDRKDFVIYWVAFWTEYISIRIEVDNIIIKLNSKSEKEIILFRKDCTEISFDSDGFDFEIFPATKSAEIILSLKESDFNLL